MIPPPGGYVGRDQVVASRATDVGRHPKASMLSHDYATSHDAPAFRPEAGHRQGVG